MVRAAELSVADRQDWDALEQAATNPNPFLTPTWVESWWAERVAADDRLVVLVRNPDSGELVGLAPLYRQEIRLGPLKAAWRLLPVGAGAGGPYELPGHLSAAGAHREVTRALVGQVLDAGAGWGVVSLSPEQGWFEPEHLLVPRASASFWQHLRPRACVVLRLAPTWDEVRTGFKRNLKESLRRSRNRLTKSGRTFAVRHRTGADLDDAAVRRLFDLHGRRARNPTAGIGHEDAFGEAGVRRLLRATLPRLAERSRASIFELEHDGSVVASQLALHGSRSSYVHSSGFLPEVWDLGPVTLLVEALVRHAIERGDEVVNFSPGPRVSKLRWSEEYWVSNEFAFGGGRKADVRRYEALRILSSLNPHVVGLNTTFSAPEGARTPRRGLRARGRGSLAPAGGRRAERTR